MTQIEISDDDNLLRRVPFSNPDYIRPDGRLTSLAFQLKKGEKGISVDVEKLTTYEKSILDIKRFRLFQLQVTITRKNGLDVIHDPTEDNNAHALIVGNLTKPISRILAQNSMRIHFPD